MDVVEAFVSGIVQGITEFLPVSSSGHLVLVHSFFGRGGNTIFFDICLHFATMASVLIFFRNDIRELFASKGVVWRRCIILGTIPAAVAGLLFEKHAAVFFGSPRVVSSMLILTSLVLVMAHFLLLREARIISNVNIPKALAVGASQALAIVPGLSRSGLTISTGIFLGMKAEDSFRFSFLLSIPIVAGATLYKLSSVIFLPGSEGVLDFTVLMCGMFSAFFAGLLGLFFLRKAIFFRKLWVFSAYCFLLGVTGLILWP